MSNKRIIPVYYNVPQGEHYNASGFGLIKTWYPYLKYREKPLAQIQLVTAYEDGSFVDYTGLAGLTTFTVALDTDYDTDDSAKQVMMKIENSDINVAGDWIDGGNADPDIGQISVRLDGDNSVFESRFVDEEASLDAHLEITGYDGAGDKVAIIEMPWRCLNIIDDDASAPPAPTIDFYTKAQSDARYALLENWEQYTEDGVVKFRLVYDGVVYETWEPPDV